MSRKRGVIFILYLSAAIFLGESPDIFAQEPKPIKLLEPRLEQGKLLMQALKSRQSQREFSERALPLEVLSDLLWAADGISRPESGKRTAPTAMNAQEIDIYVATKEGVYLFDAKQNQLNPVLVGDIRAQTGKQPYVACAAINLVYVADFSRMGMMSPESKEFYSATDTGFISQNVYLYCASAGLATVVRGMFDGGLLKKILKLRNDQKVILVQSVGYPKEN